MDPAIEIKGLAKAYNLGELHRNNMLREAIVQGLTFPFRKRKRHSKDQLWALNDVSFQVQEGEVVGLIGRNGAGKSTLLKVLSRITQPTSGEVWVKGRLAALLEVGTGFHPEMTGRENIYLNGSILGMTRQEILSRLDAIVEFAGVERFLDTPIKRYSSGMRLRLGFAVAAHLEPDILLVDEVLAVGDVGFQRQCLARMGELQSGGRTVLFVSHNLTAVESLCSRVVWIDGGRVRQDGPAQEVIREYLNCFANDHQPTLEFQENMDRGGDGRCRISSVEFTESDGSPKEVIRSGDSLVVRLHFNTEEEIRDPHFGLTLTTETGVTVSILSTWSNGLEIGRLTPGSGSIDLDIDFLNLMPGKYFLSLWIKGVGSVSYDVLENCMALNVERSDFYESGRGIDPKFGLMFFPCRWHMPSVVSETALTRS